MTYIACDFKFKCAIITKCVCCGHSCVGVQMKRDVDGARYFYARYEDAVDVILFKYFSSLIDDFAHTLLSRNEFWHR